MKDQQPTAKKFSWSFKNPLPHFGVSPEGDWKIIFLSTTILMILAIAFSFFMFIKIDKGEVFVVERPITHDTKVLDLKLLAETVLYYQGKAIEFERLKKEGVSSTDPSL